MELPEPLRLRNREPEEESKLSDFQEELVLLAAALKGEHQKDDKIVEKMRVFEAANYVGIAFQKFMEESENAIRNGAHDSHIIVPAGGRAATNPQHTTFLHKIFSCLVCDN